MMSNSPWTFVADAPIPDGEDVLVYLSEAHLGSRFAIHVSRRGGDCWIRTINGRFVWDFTTPILAWRRMADLEMEIPMVIEEDVNRGGPLYP